jgi:hypothetical protein
VHLKIVCAFVAAVLALPTSLAAQSIVCQSLPANASGLAPDLDFVADPGVLVDEAWLPKAFVDEAGAVHLFYEQDAPMLRQMYAVAADGLTFTGHRPEQPGDLRYHPFRVRMPNGVWRMFSYDPRRVAITSRSSGDGVTFSDDPGIRYSADAGDRGWIGIHEQYDDGQGRIVMLYLGDRFGLNNVRRAVSTDNGWTFTFERGDVLGDAEAVRATGGASAYVDQKSIRLDGAARRLFAMKQGCAIYSFLTTDGDQYVQEPGYRVSITSWSDLSIRSLHDPVVVRLPDGRFRMYVCAVVNDAGRTTPHSVIISATTRVPVTYTRAPVK